MAHFCLPGLSGSRNNLSTMTDPVIIPPTAAHTATVIFLHGLGDTGHGWSSVFKDEIREPFIKYICPHAPVRPVTLNMGMQMPAWYDLYGLTPEAEEDVDGIEESAKLIHSMIDSEVRAGISSDKIVVGGFSMGGALALYAGLTYDKPLAGILGLSSFLIRKDRDCTANKEIPIFMGHGDQDFLVPLTFGRLTEEYLKKFNRNVELKVYRGMSHSSCSEELEDAKQFLLKRLSPK
uniref:palmitoyl-protein hydrolase n=1 Tax=Syphacia muris TaxID=451379 RepID=A0A0N5AL58_9BILA